MAVRVICVSACECVAVIVACVTVECERFELLCVNVGVRLLCVVTEPMFDRVFELGSRIRGKNASQRILVNTSITKQDSVTILRDCNGRDRVRLHNIKDNISIKGKQTATR